MTTISVATKIWMKAVLLFSISIGLTGIIKGEFGMLMFAAMVFIFGFIISLPLLLPVFTLLHISKQLSKYSIPARLAWLIFYLIPLFYFYCVLILTVSGFNGALDLSIYLIFSMTAVLLIAVLNTRKSLNELYTQPK